MTKFEQDTEETPVIFRVWKGKDSGDVLALFPAQCGDSSPYTCGSYAHVGQHGSADPQHVMQATRKATPLEYANLKAELESAPYGYRLKIYNRLQRSFLDARRAGLRGAA